MSDIEVTNEDCIHFTVGMLQVLTTQGFHVRNAKEAFVCLKGIVDSQVAYEINRSMEDAQCQNCKATSGSRNTAP